MNNFLCGWLSREGVFYSCNEYEHISLAQELEENLNLCLSKEGYNYHDEGLLEELGWMKFTQSRFFRQFKDYPDKGNAFYMSLEQLSVQQKEWIKENFEKMSQRQKTDCKFIIKELGNLTQ